MPSNKPPYSNLELVARVDEWPYYSKDPEGYKTHMEGFYYFLIAGFNTPFGYIPRTLVQQMPWPNFWSVDHNKRTVTLEEKDNNFERRTELMHQTLHIAIESPKVELISRWDNELFPLYDANGEVVAHIDGIAQDTFGIINFAVHMIGWVNTTEGVRYWIPRRANNQKTYPNMLDNTVGGSLSAGETPIDCIVRESEEELCLPPEYTRANVRACGTASFSMKQTDDGRSSCQHQVQYLYEMEFGEDVKPEIGDGEVGEIHLMDLEQVRGALRNGEFKLNCAVTWIAFLIRHGHINAENEPNLLEICSRLHRKHDLFIV